MRYAANTTYREVVDVIKEACDKHLSINTFATGPIHYLDSKSQNVEYPLMFARPLSSQGLQRSLQSRILSFEMFSLDVPKLQDDEALDVMSNTELWLYDVLAFINRGEYQNMIEVTLRSIAPVHESFQDRVSGWSAQVDISVPFNTDFCTAAFTT